MPEYAAGADANAASIEDATRSRRSSLTGMAWWVVVATTATALEVFGVALMIAGM